MRLKWKFFCFFVGLGILISVSVGLLMYAQYDEFIRHTYTTTLNNALDLTNRKQPMDKYTISTLLEAQDDPFAADGYWDRIESLRDIKESFSLAYVYLMDKSNGRYRFLMLSDATPATWRGFTYYEKVPPELDGVFATKTRAFTKPFTDEFGSFIGAYLPVIENGEVIAVWGADYHYDYIAKMRNNATIALLGSLLASIIISGALAFLISASLTKPINKLEVAAGSLANLDFNIDIIVDKKDEIGSMQKAFIKIRDSLKKSIETLNSHLLKMVASGRHLNSVITESSSALGTINDNMEAMQKKSNNQLNSLIQTSDAVDNIVKSIDDLNNAVYTQSDHIVQSSSAIEQMIANTNSIRSIVKDTSKTTDTLTKSSSHGHSMMNKLAEEIKHIQQQSKTLQSANKTISDIAAQTNILAMNAAIEAAHAGESGKGFAVVAGEIRKLAELSSKESEAISNEILKMEKGISQITSVSNETVKSMETIFTEIKNMDSSFLVVNNAVEEQSSGGAQILTALKTIQDMTGNLRNGSDTIHKQSGSIHKNMEMLEEISQDITKRLKDVKSASQNIASLLENTKKIASIDS